MRNFSNGTANGVKRHLGRPPKPRVTFTGEQIEKMVPGSLEAALAAVCLVNGMATTERFTPTLALVATGADQEMFAYVSELTVPELDLVIAGKASVDECFATRRAKAVATLARLNPFPSPVLEAAE
jgi:hypothetical protein